MKKSAFCKMVKESIEDEEKASRFYDRMKRGQSLPVKRTIESIKRDELRHNRIFRRLDRELCR